MKLHTKPLNLSNCTTKDLEAISQFHKIAKNYIKLDSLNNNKKDKNENTRNTRHL